MVSHNEKHVAIIKVLISDFCIRYMAGHIQQTFGPESQTSVASAHFCNITPLLSSSGRCTVEMYRCETMGIRFTGLRLRASVWNKFPIPLEVGKIKLQEGKNINWQPFESVISCFPLH